jgi:hypothetical protein
MTKTEVPSVLAPDASSCGGHRIRQSDGEEPDPDEWPPLLSQLVSLLEIGVGPDGSLEQRDLAFAAIAVLIGVVSET